VEAGLAWLQWGLANHEGHSGRGQVSVGVARASLALLTHRLGGRVSPQLNAKEARKRLAFREAGTYGDRQALDYLLAGRQAARERGEDLEAAGDLSRIAMLLWRPEYQDGWQFVQQESGEALTILAHRGTTDDARFLHLRLYGLELDHGGLGEAERHLTSLASWATGTEYEQHAWDGSLGRFAMAQGRWSGAAAAFAGQVVWAERKGYLGGGGADGYRLLVDLYEREGESAHRRRSRPTSRRQPVATK